MPGQRLGHLPPTSAPSRREASPRASCRNFDPAENGLAWLELVGSSGLEEVQDDADVGGPCDDEGPLFVRPSHGTVRPFRNRGRIVSKARRPPSRRALFATGRAIGPGFKHPPLAGPVPSAFHTGGPGQGVRPLPVPHEPPPTPAPAGQKTQQPDVVDGETPGSGRAPQGGSRA